MLELRPTHRLSVLLKVAGVARSSFYYQAKALQAVDKYVELKAQIKAIYRRHQGRYGYRRITTAIRLSGRAVNHKTVQNLMGELQLKSLVRPKKYRSYRGTVGTVAPNRLKQRFSASRPNLKWVTDLTEFNINGRKLFLSPVMDLYNGEIVAYQMGERATFELIGGMLKKAFAKLTKQDKPLLHSDQGWQYQMKAYRRLLKERSVKQSMSRKGNCLDNAAMESFFGTLKAEYFHLNKFTSLKQLRSGLIRYIRYYNNDRIKLKLNGLSPVQYRNLHLKPGV